MNLLKVMGIALLAITLTAESSIAQTISAKKKKAPTKKAGDTKNTTETKTTETKTTTETTPTGSKTTETKKTTETTTGGTKTTETKKTETIKTDDKTKTETTKTEETKKEETKSGKSLLDGLTGGASGLGKALGLTNDDAALGVKDALLQGIRKGVNIVSVTDGFFKNPAIKIPLPQEAAVVESTLRKVGMGSKVDEAILSMNRGAEDAAKSATNIFVDAIKQMTITDALNIVKGSDNACTQYLQNKSTNNLKTAFSPIVAKSLEKTQATRYWADLMGAYNKVPFVKKVNPNLNEYVTEKAIEGLFKMVAQEEANIRKNPGNRTTDILKKVFGN